MLVSAVRGALTARLGFGSTWIPTTLACSSLLESFRPSCRGNHEVSIASTSADSERGDSVAAGSATSSGRAASFDVLDDKVDGPYKVEPKPVFAVVEISGTQYKVTPDDVVITEKIRGVDVNDKLRLNRVLLLGSQTETVIGRPYVGEASVTAAVEEQFLDGKVIVFKKRRRKNSRRTNGHRQPLTSLRILSVDGI
jgi:large subunit ribosomal protein L21